MAIFGFGQQDPYAEAEQAAQDRQTAFAGMKDNLPALGLIAGLSMLARNNGSRSVGQLIGMAGGDALNAYGTWRKMQDIKDRQAQLDKIAAEQREYDRSQDAFRNDLALKQFGLQEAKMAQDMQIARQNAGIAAARLALARQEAAKTSLGNYNEKLQGFVDPYTGKFTPVQFPEGYTPPSVGDDFQKVSEGAAKELVSLGALDSHLSEIEGLVKGHPKATGPVIGSGPGKMVSPYFDPNGVDTRSTIMNLATQMKNEAAGANLSLSEKEWLSYIPTESDTAETILKKVNAFRRVLRGKADSWQKVYGPHKMFSGMGIYAQQETPEPPKGFTRMGGGR